VPALGLDGAKLVAVALLVFQFRSCTIGRPALNLCWKVTGNQKVGSGIYRRRWQLAFRQS
jgi:hypothetical protein